MAWLPFWLAGWGAEETEPALPPVQGGFVSFARQGARAHRVILADGLRDASHVGRIGLSLASLERRALIRGLQSTEQCGIPWLERALLIRPAALRASQSVGKLAAWQSLRSGGIRSAEATGRPALWLDDEEMFLALAMEEDEALLLALAGVD